MSSEIISLAPSGLEHLSGSEQVGVSAEDMIRVNEQAARAAFAHQMTGKSQQSNGQIAQFLQFLFTHGPEYIWTDIEVFVLQIALDDRKFLTHERIALWLPWYPKEADTYDLIQHIGVDYHIEAMVMAYPAYLLYLAQTLPQFASIDFTKLQTYLIRIVQLYRTQQHLLPSDEERTTLATYFLPLTDHT